LASYLHARANQGLWLLRIDDIDSPRVVKGSAESIIDTLQNYGLLWDGSVYYQSDHTQSYQQAIDKLSAQEQVYPCSCSRKTLSALNSPVYPGTCRSIFHQKPPCSLRLKTEDLEIAFDDELQDQQIQNIASQHGDFIIKRKDNITAYQLAVVIDDQQQGVTHVVRGFDLLDSTIKQLYLYKLLGHPPPSYCHVPVIVDSAGNKLSKQKSAQAVSMQNPQKTLFLLLELLQQNPPSKLKKSPVDEIINWGIEHWHSAPLKKIRAINFKID